MSFLALGVAVLIALSGHFLCNDMPTLGRMRAVYLPSSRSYLAERVGFEPTKSLHP